MALLVWLPLNGNLNNLGLSNVTIINNGATIDDNGKIGKCYYFNSTNGSSGATMYIPNFSISNTKFSVCGWFKIVSVVLSGSAEYLICLNNNTYSGDMLFSIAHRNLGLFIIVNNTEYTILTLTANMWYHISLTFSNSVAKVYINGNEVNSRSITSTPYIGSVLNIGSRSSATNGTNHAYYSKIYANDVRIYDHCLSPKEVHEIAKGLVLHYPLDDPYSESTINLGNTSTTYSNQTEGNAYTASSWGGDAGTITYYKSGGYNNGPYKVYHKTATGSGGIYRKTANDITIVEGKTYTMSIYIKASRDYTDSVHSFNINGVTSSDSNHYITASSSVHFTTEWTRIEKTFTASANDAGTYGEMSIVYNDNITDYYVYFSCFQIEEKDHATPFVIDTRTGVVIDTSGYLNNGTITGLLLISNNTSRYKNSVHLPDSASSIKIGNLSTMIPEKIFTFNIWFKKITDKWSTKSWETILGGPNGFELESKNGGNSSCNIVAYSWGGNSSSKYIPYQIDTWNMLTMTRDTSESKFYLNGELKYTGTAGSVPSGNYFIGAWNTATQQNYRGYLSDARLYTTILSNEDILELYNTSALIDNKGNINCFLAVESNYETNILDLAQQSLTKKTWGNSLFNDSSLSKAVVTLTDTGLRVYREPNNTSTSSGTGEGKQNNWGGFVLRNTDNVFGLLDGHTYLILVDVKGKSDTAMVDNGWRHHVGWNYTNTGIAPAPTNTRMLNPVNATFNSDNWVLVSYKFTISDTVYKVATSTYLYHTQGETYLAYYQFKLGWTYSTTGAVGTDVYFNNLRMFDITYNTPEELNVNKQGIIEAFSFTENGDNAFIDRYSGSNSNQLIEI